MSLLQKFIEPVFFHRWRGVGTRIDLRLVFWAPEKEVPTPMTDQKIAFLLAPGAGAPSMHPRMKTFAGLLASIGSVHSFDYAYATEGRKSPDRLPNLIDTHRAALDALRQKHSGPIVLVGKSMGGRVGCHVALVEKVAATSASAIRCAAAAIRPGSATRSYCRSRLPCCSFRARGTGFARSIFSKACGAGCRRPTTSMSSTAATTLCWCRKPS
jgi:pimeloyl-ACP methyl ester carboxylesterase